VEFVTVVQAAEIIKEGGVVAVPTETVYGLAADATNARAVKRIYKIKNRPQDNPLICHFDSFASAKKFVTAVPQYAEALAKSFLPGPVSLLLKLPANSPLLPATGGRNSVIIRVPDHSLFIKLLKKLDFPLAAPSANTSGKYSPTNAQMVEKDLGKKIDGIIDGGQSKVGLESTIIDCRKKNEVRILRQGAIGTKEIKRALRSCGVTVKETVRLKETTPGSRYRHYAPRTPVYEISSLDEIKQKTPFILLALKEQIPLIRQWMKKQGLLSDNILLLGAAENKKGIAKNLYRHFYELDELNVSSAYILKTDWSGTSVGKAIADRLNRVISK